MPNHIMQAILVSGINTGDRPDQEPVLLAYDKAITIFDNDLVTALTKVGHNFVQSFCVLPSGSGAGRVAQSCHQEAVKQFVSYLETLSVEYVAVRRNDSEPAFIEHTSET